MINNGIIYIIQHNQEKEKEVKRAKKEKEREFILERQSGMISMTSNGYF